MKDFIQNIEKSKTHAALWSLLVLAFIVCYYPTFQWLNYKYQGTESYYSHGYLIPLVSAYLIYLKKNDLKEVQPSSNQLGLLIIILALMLHLFGILGDVNFVSSFSMVFYLAGCSLFLLGGEFTKKISFPLFFLVFMCPIPNILIDVIALPFKSMATTLSLYLIGLLGIPYIREGFIVHFAASTFVVGTPCNGMRSLIAFLALGFLVLYFMRTSWWKKALFLTIIPPISIILNGARIAILLYIANRYGQEAASPESFLHDGSGLLVFVAGFAALIIFSRVINEER